MKQDEDLEFDYFTQEVVKSIGIMAPQWDYVNSQLTEYDLMLNTFPALSRLFEVDEKISDFNGALDNARFYKEYMIGGAVGLLGLHSILWASGNLGGILDNYLIAFFGLYVLIGNILNKNRKYNQDHANHLYGELGEELGFSNLDKKMETVKKLVDEVPRFIRINESKKNVGKKKENRKIE